MAKVEVEIRSMKMDVDHQPPWANELLTRNRKVGRTIWSTSDIHQGTSSFTFEYSTKGIDKNEYCGSGKRTEDNKVTDPTTTRVPRTGNSIHEDVYSHGYPSAPLSSVVPGGDMKEHWKSSGEESILEYGPGIVRKLRSKYQSLAARQPLVRPSLNRSSSLEHSLDFQQPEHPQVNLPVPPSPRPGSVSPGVENGQKEMMTLNVRTTATYAKVQNGTSLKVRGRAGGNADRMRRARSVDSLHHNNHYEYTRQEEEILEKLKTVVMPKEEVVIIEMSKPRLNLGNLNGNEHQNAINALVSPEHELPPHFIVRDTARKFETNPGTALQWKKIGQVLKLSKSPSLSPPSSLCGSPLPSSPVPIITSAEKKVQIVPAQPTQPRERRPSKHENENEDSPKMLNNFQATKMASGNNLAGVNIQTTPPGKQVGVIRPTVNGIQKSTSATTLSRPTSLPRRDTPSPSSNSKRAFQFITPPTRPTVGPKPTLGKTKTVDLDKDKIRNSPTKETLCEKPSSEIQRPMDLKLKVQTSSRSAPTSPSSAPVSNVETNNAEATPLVAFPVKLKAVPKPKKSLEPQGNVRNVKQSSQPVAVPSESQNNVKKVPYNDTEAPKPNPVTAVPAHFAVAREGDALKKSKPTVPESKESEEKPSSVSQLRSHQKQKLQQSSAGGSMVFNFTSRNKVPDYIEDDGLHTSRGGGGKEDFDDAVDGLERIDPKLIQFIGANVLINGKSSIQKKPKSEKMSIRFNEEGTTTFEYPSELSVLRDDDSESTNTSPNNNPVTESNTALRHNGGGGLSNYIPNNVVSNSYQLGFYGTDSNSNRKSPPRSALDEESKGDVIEDYLKPDTESTTWSNELGAADILF